MQMYKTAINQNLVIYYDLSFVQNRIKFGKLKAIMPFLS